MWARFPARTFPLEDYTSTTLQYIAFPKTASYMLTAIASSKHIFIIASRPPFRTTQPAKQWVPEASPREQSVYKVKLSLHLHEVSSLAILLYYIYHHTSTSPTKLFSSQSSYIFISIAHFSYTFYRQSKADDELYVLPRVNTGVGVTHWFYSTLTWRFIQRPDKM